MENSKTEVVHLPESPAIRIFNRPIPFPSSVKGRRLGIFMLGMISWGALPLSIMLEDWSKCPSPEMLREPLARSSEKDPSREFRREEVLLKAEAGPEVPSMMGVMGCERDGWAWLEGVPIDLYDGVVGLDSSSNMRRAASTDASVLDRGA